MTHLRSRLLSSVFVGAIASTGLLIAAPAQADNCSGTSMKGRTQAGLPVPVAEAGKPAAKVGTIVDVASANPSFSTLVAAVKAAGLVETLSGSGPFTVFAPTDAAFAALPAGTVEKLLLPENIESLKKVLTYHVVSGKLPAKRLSSGSVSTVEGSPVKVNVKTGKVTVNGAKVISADVPTSNGVIHVIDTVLLPPNL